MMNNLPLRVAVLEADPAGSLSRLLAGRSFVCVKHVGSVADLVDPKAAFDLALVDPELGSRWPMTVAAELHHALGDRLVLCCRSAADAALLRQRLDGVMVLERARLDAAALDALLRAQAHRCHTMPSTASS